MSTKKAIFGFTLIELLSMIALIGIMAIAALTFIPSVSNSHLSTAAQQVLSDIEYARQNATTTRINSGLIFTSGGSYSLYQGSSATPLADPLTQQNMVINLANKYPGISIVSNYTLEFDSLGAPSLGGGGSLTITNGKSNLTISISPNTGKAVIQ